MTIPQWSRFEHTLTSAHDYPNPLQDTTLQATFTAPSGKTHTVDGFWDGDRTWRVRFAPDEIGTWHFTATCSDTENTGLHDQSGNFTCGEPQGQTSFAQHGPLRVSDNRRYLVHADGTPFFWMADTAWNGPLHATPEEWDHYLKERTRQKFTASQWMATQSVASPIGNRERQFPYSGQDNIAINPAFFHRLDARHKALNDAGFLSVIALLWAAEWSTPSENAANPGHVLPEDQLIRLGRYMVARWGADLVAYFLAGDGLYLGEKAPRWHRIGRAIFGDKPRAPVTMHPAGMQWIADDFKDEAWYDFIGYQSGHGDDEPTMAWLNSGPPATAWRNAPPRPIINLEPPYEDHISYQNKTRFDDQAVRRAMYWSLLVSPTAGVSYGGHGVWGWDDGTTTPMGHPTTGVPKHWRQALLLPGAEQVAHLVDCFTSIEWWRLQPAQDLISQQPGDQHKRRFVAAARSANGDLAVVYIPEDRSVELCLDGMATKSATWVNPRTGERLSTKLASDSRIRVETPASGDWLLLLMDN